MLTNLEEQVIDFTAKTEELVSLFPQLKNKKSDVVICYIGEEKELSDGTVAHPVLLAQNQVMQTGTAKQNALSHFMGWKNHRTLRTIQNMSSNIVKDLKVGSSLDGDFNLQLERSISPFYEGQEKVLDPSTGDVRDYYQNVTIVMGEPSHDPIPETPKDLD